MSNIDKQALREAAEKAGSDEWCAFIDTKSKTYAVHTPADNRCGDVVKWAGFDGQQRAAAKAKFIAAANPATVLALLDELEAAEKLNAELMEKQRLIDICQGQGLEHRIAAEKRAEAAEKRIAELERKEQHSERQSVIDALAGSGEEWSDIEEYMQKWDAERASAAGKGE